MLDFDKWVALPNSINSDLVITLVNNKENSGWALTKHDVIDEIGWECGRRRMGRESDAF